MALPGPTQGGPSRSPVNNTGYKPLLEAVRNGNLDATENFLKAHPEAVNARITSQEETALHIAALLGHLHIVERLVQLMSEDDLELKDLFGMTALHVVTLNKNENNIKSAKCMVEKNERLPTIPDRIGWIPVTTALDFDQAEMAPYLYSVTPFEVLLSQNGKPGAQLLTLCYYYKMFDIALDLIRRYPRFVMREVRGGLTFLQTLATVPPYAFLREIHLPFWKRWLLTWVRDVYQEPAFAINEVAINIPPETTERRDDHVRGTSRGLLHRWVRIVLHLLGVKKIYETGLAHKQYLELLHAACNVIPTLSEEEIHESGVYSAVLKAAERGNPEFIVEAVKVHLPLMWTRTPYARGLFPYAVQFRQEKVFNLIYGFVLKHSAINQVDAYGNCLLHMAGLQRPPTRLNHISGALLQMQRELQWFKAVESITPPTKKEFLNMDSKTPRELFTENHKELVKQGEKWTKGTASSSSLIAALVATITFAAAFTVPGGNDQTKGYPIFLLRKLFILFAISDAMSLFSSSTSLLMFLGLLTSRYAEDDFLKSLPTRLIIGLSTMFISLATMMVAFCAVLFLMLQDQYSWIVIPVTVLASVPITLYICLQFPLLVEIFMSTYGPGIFHRNVKPWP